MLALAVPSLLPAQQEALDRAPRESIVLPSGAVVYPQGTDPNLLAPESGLGPDPGCGSGNFCPDTPVTRGQMAVFLAKALGLHWPAF